MLSDNKLLLLAMGINRKGILYAEDFNQVYSSKEVALSSIQSLRAWGYIQIYSDISCGVFRVVKAPGDAFKIAKNLKKEQKSLKRQ